MNITPINQAIAFKAKLAPRNKYLIEQKINSYNARDYYKNYTNQVEQALKISGLSDFGSEDAQVVLDYKSKPFKFSGDTSKYEYIPCWVVFDKINGIQCSTEIPVDDKATMNPCITSYRYERSHKPYYQSSFVEEELMDSTFASNTGLIALEALAKADIDEVKKGLAKDYLKKYADKVTPSVYDKIVNGSLNFPSV